MNHVTRPLNSADTSAFPPGNQQNLLYQEIQIWIAFYYIISNSFNFFEPLKVVLINMVIILMIPSKTATLGLLKKWYFKKRL